MAEDLYTGSTIFHFIVFGGISRFFGGRKAKSAQNRSEVRGVVQLSTI